MAACHVVMLREAPASPPIMSQGSYLRVSSFPRGFHPPTPPAVVFLPSVPSVCPISPFPPPPGSYHDPTESPFSPRYFTAPRTLLRVLYLLVFSGLVFIPNAASRMRTFVVYMYVYVNICTYIRSYTHAKGECVWPILALMRTPPRMRGPPSASFLLSLFLSLRLSSPLNPRDFSTPDRER